MAFQQSITACHQVHGQRWRCRRVGGHFRDTDTIQLSGPGSCHPGLLKVGRHEVALHHHGCRLRSGAAAQEDQLLAPPQPISAERLRDGPPQGAASQRHTGDDQLHNADSQGAGAAVDGRKCQQLQLSACICSSSWQHRCPDCGLILGGLVPSGQGKPGEGMLWWLSAAGVHHPAACAGCQQPHGRLQVPCVVLPAPS